MFLAGLVLAYSSCFISLVRSFPSTLPLCLRKVVTPQASVGPPLAHPLYWYSPAGCPPRVSPLCYLAMRPSALLSASIRLCVSVQSPLPLFTSVLLWGTQSLSSSCLLCAVPSCFSPCRSFSLGGASSSYYGGVNEHCCLVTPLRLLSDALLVKVVLVVAK